MQNNLILRLQYYESKCPSKISLTCDRPSFRHHQHQWLLAVKDGRICEGVGYTDRADGERGGGCVRGPAGPDPQLPATLPHRFNQLHQIQDNQYSFSKTSILTAERTKIIAHPVLCTSKTKDLLQKKLMPLRKI